MKTIPDIVWRCNKATDSEVFTHLEECNTDFDPPLDQKVNIRDYASKIVEHAVTFEAWHKEILVGLIAVYFNDKENHTGYITNVSVSTGQKGKGLASVLMGQCITYARQHEFKEIRLEVGATNSPAIQLYRKYGFSEVEEKAGALFMKYVVSGKDETS